MNPEQKFVCYGAGNKKIVNWITQQSKSIPNLEFKGSLARGSAHRNAFKKAKALVMPTRLPEALGRTNFEAFTKGTPVIGFPNGALPELVNEKVGFLSQDISELSRALHQTFNNHEVYEYSKKFHVNEEIRQLFAISQSTVSNGSIR